MIHVTQQQDVYTTTDYKVYTSQSVTRWLCVLVLDHICATDTYPVCIKNKTNSASDPTPTKICFGSSKLHCSTKLTNDEMSRVCTTVYNFTNIEKWNFNTAIILQILLDKQTVEYL